jgi:predicted ATPase
LKNSSTQARPGGNPFFVEQFLQLLQQHEGYLRFSFQTYRWEWSNVVDIRQGANIISSEVADVVASSMRKLDHT